jgi:RNA polymerase sigma factor (sigma-70 family)
VNRTSDADVVNREVDQAYRMHAEAVRRRALRAAAGDHQRAEDATQQAFLEAWQDWPRFRQLPPGGQLAWLAGRARNRVIDSWRKGRAELPADDIPDQPAPGTAEGLALSGHALGRFWEAVTTTATERAANAAYLRWHEDWTMAQIARHLGVDRATVKRDLDAVCAMARELLQAEDLGRREP